MRITPEDVRRIARLARLSFTEEERKVLAGQMEVILGYMSQLDALDTEDVPPMAHASTRENVFREDVVRPRITREEALSVAPEASDAYFRVPRVIE